MIDITKGLAAAAFVAGMWAVAAEAQAAERYGLEELRAIARSRHPSLASAQAAIDAVEAFRLDRRRLDDPTVSFGVGRADGGLETGSEWQLELGQRFELPGLRGWRLRRADAELERSRSEQLAVAAMVGDEVGRLWLESVLATRAAEVAEQSEAISRRLLELLERRVDAGESAPLEAVQARIEWFDRRRLAAESRRGVEAAKAALDILCRRVLGRDFEVEGELDGGSDGPRELPSLDNLLERLVVGNPELLARQAAVAAAEAARNVERRSALPELELTLSRESELDKEATGAALALRLPLWNRNRAGIAVAEADLEARRAEVDSNRLDLELELEKAVFAYRSAAEAIDLYQEGWREATRSAVGIASFSFENGESSLLEVLDAQRSDLAVGLAEVEARALLTRSRLRIEQLLNAPLFRGEDP